MEDEDEKMYWTVTQDGYKKITKQSFIERRGFDPEQTAEETNKNQLSFEDSE